MSETLHLLSEAIATRDAQGGSSFYDGEVKRLLAKAFQEDNGVFELPSGDSILVYLFRVSPSLTSYWFNLRGPGAWSATPTHKFPLFSFSVLLNKSFKCEGGRSLKNVLMSSTALGGSLRSMFFSGIEVAMPLSIDLALATKHSSVSKDCFLAQANLVKSMIGFSYLGRGGCDDVLPVSELWKLFHSANGALVFNQNLEALNVDLSDTMWLPTSPVWRISSGPAKIEHGPWWKVWSETCSDHNEFTHILPWIEKAGIDITDINIKRISQKVSGLTIGSSSLDGIWQKVYECLSEENAWGLERNGRLLWQEAVFKLGLIKAVINNPPPCGLSQKSSAGIGVWDFSSPCSIQTPQYLIKNLLTACPLDVNLPILWTQLSNQSSWSKAGLKLSRMCLPGNVQQWVGSKGLAQTSWAAALLLKTCNKNLPDREDAAKTIQLLIETPVAHQHLNEVSLIVLWTFQQITKSGVLSFTKPLTGAIDLPENFNQCVPLLIEELRLDAVASDLDSSCLAALKSSLLSHSLNGHHKKKEALGSKM